MDERELPSDSEESDVDYVPSGEEGQLSEEESDGEVEDVKADEDQDGSKPASKKSLKRRKSKSKKSRKRARVATPEPEEAEKDEETIETEEAKKKKADDIWAAFKQETSIKPTSKVDDKSKEKDTEKPTESKVATKPATVTKIFEFAGEKVEVTEEIKPSVSKPTPVTTQPTVKKTASASAAPRKLGLGILGKGGAGIPSRATVGLAGLLGNLNKKNKLSTLEKSKLDWEGFKKKEGIDEEIQTHNKGKHGYLEKQDFLQRADLRQFELEKQMRSTVRRSNR